MARILCGIILLLSLLTAQGQWLTVRTSGWEADVLLPNQSTGGFYDFGWSNTNNIPTGTEQVILTVEGPGYRGAVSNIYERTVYGTIQLRQAYPNEASPQEQASGSDVIVGISLSEWIYTNEVVTSVTIKAGFYNDGGDNSLIELSSATNSSQQVYGETIANWVGREYTVVSNTLTLYVDGGHGEAQEGKSFELVRFITSDGTTHVTNDVSSTSRDAFILNDANPALAYIATVDVSSLNDGQIRSDFIAFPRVGTNVFDTRANRYTGFTPYPTSRTNYNASAATYSDAVAVVGTVGGDPSVTNVAPGEVNSAHYFGSISAAAAAIASYNNSTFGHNDVGGGTIYVRNGITVWSGGTGTYGTTPGGELIITNYPGETVTFTSASGDKSLGGRLRIVGSITLDIDSGGSMLNNAGYVCLEGVTIDSAQDPLIDGTGIVDMLHCTTTDLEQNTRSDAAGDELYFRLIRGCTFAWDDTFYFFTAVGNTVTGGNLQTGNAANPPGYIPDWLILHNHKQLNQTVAADIGNVTGITNGAWLANVIIEQTDTNVASLAIGTSQSNNYTNITQVGVMLIGGRTQQFYNDIGTAAAWRVLCRRINCGFDVGGFKTDTFGTPDGARIGNWSVMYSVGSSGTYIPDRDGIQGASANYHLEFDGISSWQINGTAVSATNVWDFVDEANDDYHPGPNSPLRGLRWRRVLSHDLEGKRILSSSPSGALVDPIRHRIVVETLRIGQ